MLKVETYPNPVTGEVTMAVKFEPMRMVEAQTAHDVVREIVRSVAERYVAENYSELIAKLDQQAIANLVIAECGKKIAEEIRLTPGRMRVDVDARTFKNSIF